MDSKVEVEDVLNALMGQKSGKEESRKISSFFLATRWLVLMFTK